MRLPRQPQVLGVLCPYLRMVTCERPLLQLAMAGDSAFSHRTSCVLLLQLDVQIFCLSA